MIWNYLLQSGPSSTFCPNVQRRQRSINKRNKYLDLRIRCSTTVKIQRSSIDNYIYTRYTRAQGPRAHATLLLAANSPCFSILLSQVLSTFFCQSESMSLNSLSLSASHDPEHDPCMVSTSTWSYQPGMPRYIVLPLLLFLTPRGCPPR